MKRKPAVFAAGTLYLFAGAVGLFLVVSDGAHQGGFSTAQWVAASWCFIEVLIGIGLLQMQRWAAVGAIAMGAMGILTVFRNSGTGSVAGIIPHVAVLFLVLCNWGEFTGKKSSR
jgi:hypothetical protein